MVRKWYQERYIDEGIEPLIESVAQLSDYYFNHQQGLQQSELLLTYPTKAGERVRVLLNDQYFSDAVKNLYLGLSISLKPNQSGDWLAITNGVLISLRELRSLIINKEIDRKPDVYKIAQDQDIVEVAKRLDEMANSICHQAGVTITMNQMRQSGLDKIL